MSTTDLNILADAVTFAVLVSIGGLIVYAVARSTWKRHALGHSVKVVLSVAAVVAIAIGGVVLWPAAREGVNTAAGVDLDEEGDAIIPEEELEPPSPRPDLDHSAAQGRPDRVREVRSEGTDDDEVEPSPSINGGGNNGGGGNGGGNNGGGGNGGGGNGGGGNGGGGNGGGPTTSPSPSPSPPPSPSPSPSPSPPPDPSPTDEPGPPDPPVQPA
jgi:uncharacterized membrane protein YgcG